MNVHDVSVLILCGGLGSRLISALPSAPKVLAPVGDKLFLDYLLAYLTKQGVKKVILALGHKAGYVKDYLNEMTYEGLDITSFVEPHPLGTAGAVRFSLKQLPAIPKQLVIMNGDTFIDVDLGKFLSEFAAANADIAIMSVYVDDCGRYGELLLAESKDKVIGFKEKERGNNVAGQINGGVYLFNQESLQKLMNDTGSSFETDFFPKVMNDSYVMSCPHKGVFLDIGTPESFSEANEQYKKFQELMF